VLIVGGRGGALAAALLSLGAAFAACGTGSQGQPGSTDAGPLADATVDDARSQDVEASVDADAGSVMDSTAPDDAAQPDAIDGSPPSSVLAFENLVLPDGGLFAGAFGGGFASSSPPPWAGCTVTQAGACTAIQCPATRDAGSPPLVSAGTLHIWGGALGDAGMDVAEDSTHYYSFVSTAPVFGPGDVLHVSGSGATVPAFSEQSVAAPGPVVVSAPPAAGGTFTIPTSADLSVAWTGGETNASFAWAITAGANAVACRWDATAGQGTVPASLLAFFAGASPGTVVYEHTRSVTFAAGAYGVALWAMQQREMAAVFQ
jgi:hypothetical protein